MDSLIECLDHWSKTDPHRCLFTFLDMHGRELDACTYSSFQQQTNFLAAVLSEEGNVKHGCPVLLSYPPGLEMIKAFVACVKLGALPIPVPSVSRTGAQMLMTRLNSIAIDSAATTVLTDRKHQARFHKSLTKETANSHGHDLQAINTLNWVATDLISGKLQDFPVREKELLFLQYTSGSTHAPRGVMVTHQNVLHNCQKIFSYRPIIACWLPHYHDMGLIGSFLFAIISGGSSHWFSTMDFMRRPALWLETITRVKATSTSAPNFAFEYCLRQDKLPDKALQSIDLSSMRIMMNASEPVHCDTVQRFLQRFKAYGLSRRALSAAYGLAEHTLGVSKDGYIHLLANKDRLARHQPFIISGQHKLSNAVKLASAGRPFDGVDVRIVDPETLLEKPEGSPGEIWVDSPSKALGYWGKPERSRRIFHACISGSDANIAYLRTGDIGFLHDGELYICGRIDDMVVIRGRNIFPPDIETTIESHFPEIRPGRVAVFGIANQDTGESQLVVLIESRSLDLAPKPVEVYREVINSSQAPVKAVAILPHGSIIRTTSGKIARHKCRSAFMQDELEFLDLYLATESIDVNKSIGEYLDSLVQRTQRNARDSLTIAELGLDSIELVELGIRLEKSDTRGSLHTSDQANPIYDLRLLQAATIGELKLLCRQLRSGKVPISKIACQLEHGMQAIVNSEADQMRRDMSLSSDCIPMPYPPQPAQRTILLTGATGFLGSFLLEALLRLSDVPIIVLVRGQSDEHAKHRVETALAKTGASSNRVAQAILGRIQPLCGDIAQSNLGLSKSQWNALSRNVTTVYHCAAEVDYIKTYRELHPANVAGTEEIIRLCCSGQAKELNHISTTFIFGWSVIDRKWESSCNPGMTGLDFGYPQSKWVAEQLVFEAEKRGLRTRIFRPALITASESGHYMRGDINTRILSFMIRHGVSVEAENQFSILPVEICANNIIAIALLDDFRKTTFHLTAEKYYSMESVTRLIGELFAYEFTYTDSDGFVDHVNQHCSNDDDLFPLVSFINNIREKFKSTSHMRYDNADYRAYCEKSPLSKPEPDLQKTVTWIVSFLVSVGLVHPPSRLPDRVNIAQDS